MLDKLNKYKYIEKTKSELEADKIINNLTNKLWEDAGYMTIYNLGALSQLKLIAQIIDKCGYINKDAVLGAIRTYTEYEGVSDLAAMILEEFDYKENQHE